MKRKITLLTLLLVLILSLSAAAVEIKDVPKSHWAYQSVLELVDRGYLSLYEDGTFRGKDKVSRYELAEIVARILDNIETKGIQASESDINKLWALTDEFRNELVDLAIQGEAFSKQIKAIQQKNLSQDELMTQIKAEDISSLNTKLEAVDQKATENTSQIDSVKNELDQVDKRVAALDESIGSLNASLKNMVTENVDNLQSDVSKMIDSIMQLKELKEEVNSLNQRMETVATDYKNQLAARDKQINELESKVELQNARITAQSDKLAELQAQLASNEDDNDLQNIEDRQTVLTSRINSLQDELNKLKEAKPVSVEKKSNSLDLGDNGMVYGIIGVALLAILLSS